MISTVNKEIKRVIDCIKESQKATREDLLFLLNKIESSDHPYLFRTATEVKEKLYGKDVYIRGIVEFSNYCKQNCLYCGIRKDNNEVIRYRLSHQEIIDACTKGYALGYRTFVLQGGEDPYFTDEKFEAIILELKDKFPDAAITLSLGERSMESYQRLYNAGADRYLLRHESANPNHYRSLHAGMTFETREKCLYDLKKIGYQVGAGMMIGSPGQTNHHLVDDLMFLMSLKPHMVGMGPYLTHDETPFKGEVNGSLEKTLVMLALTRLLLPSVLLPATTAVGTIDDFGREQAILAGCNVVMPNISPMEVRAKYELYENKICIDDEPEHCRHCIEGRVNKTGYKLNMSRGDNVLY